jgi:uncharacterized protein
MSQLLEESPATTRPAPVSDAQRLRLLDALRGVALLGILLMNIQGFALPNYFSEPFKSDPTSVNFWLNAFITVFFEGKMRALFGMVFGASVLLFVSKREQTGRPVTGLFYRRMFWLVLFGLIHAHLILWIGDILYLYGFCGMLVYLFRNVKPTYLVLVVFLIAVIDFSANALFYRDQRAARLAYVDASKAASEGQALTTAQTEALTRWREIERTLLPNREDAKENTEKMKSDYATVAGYLRPIAFEFETSLMPTIIWDSLALMLLGLALFRWGFLSGNWPNRAYWTVLAIGYGIGLPLVCYSFYDDYVNKPTLEATLSQMEVVPIEWVGLIYPFQRILLVMAHVSAIILLYKSGFARPLFRRLEAVGQMALTNYIMQSVICTLVFFGYGLNYFAELDFYQIYVVVLGIWALQLIVSPVWLKYFLYGPLEWFWRSLTYWHLQPFWRPEAKVLC